MSILSMLKGSPRALETALREIALARQATRAAPLTLTQWVRRQGGARDPKGYVRLRGGISDDRGDVRSFAGDMRGFGSVISRNGRPVDDLTISAYESGYFPNPPSRQEFISSLEDDMRGIRRVVNDPAAQEAAEQARRTLEDFAQAGINPQLRGRSLREALQKFLTGNAGGYADDIPFAWPLTFGAGTGVMGALAQRERA